MTSPQTTSPDRGLSASRTLWTVGVMSAVVALAVLALAWAKWQPYGLKIASLADTRSWAGNSILVSAHGLGGMPSFEDAGDFLRAYFTAVWKALVAALLIAAAIEALTPTAWLARRLTDRSPGRQALMGGLASLPTMMCTCCTAPVTVGLARRGAPQAACLAYWVGNPLLNPAVLVFLLLVLPWQFVTVRVIVGAAVAIGVPALIARRVATSGPRVDQATAVRAPRQRPRALATAYLRSLLRLSVTLVPEYVVVVLLVGWLTSSLGSFDSLDARLGLAAVVVVAVLGTLFVVPTGGEIPVIVGLIASGASTSVAGVLLITLPALSIPSIVMVAGSLTWRATLAMAGAVVVAGVVAGGMLAVLL